MADLSFLDPNMNSTDETPLGAVSPDLSFLDPDQGAKPADPSALINARELTHGMDPQRTAKVIDLSRKAGLPPRIVEERMDEIERREMLNDGLLADVASKAPKTTSFLSDPDRFAVAQTDIENLAELERLIATGPVDSFAMSGQMPVNGDNKLAKELIADPIGAIGKGLIKAPGSLAEMGLNLFSILPGAIDSAAQGIEQLTGLPRGGYFGELRDAALGASKWIRENYLEAEPLQISEDLRGKGAWDNPEIMLDPEWVAYVTTDILPSIGATIAAYMAGGPAAAGVVGGGMEAGGLYQELLDEGMEDWKANTASLVYGVLSGALNAFGADKVLGRGVATSWAKRLIKGFFVKGAVEGATEWAEEPVQALVAGIARGDSVPTIAADIVEATQKGFDVFLPSLITGGIAGTATERVEYQKAQFASKEQEVLDMLTENVAQSNLAQLDPVLYREALTVLKEGGKISDIHIPASAIMSENLAEVSEILNQLGVSFEAFDLAYNSGDTVAIPVEQYGAAIAANPDLAIRFANDRKLSADGYTRNELAQFNQEWAQEAKRVLQLAAETEELKDQEDAETKAIFEQVYAVRQTAGRVPDAARLDAAQFTAALVSMAKMSEGKYTATQLFEAYMPRVTAGQPIVDQQALQQDAAYAGVENEAEVEEAGRLWAEMGTESPYFKRWSGEAPVVLKNAAPSFTTGQAVVVEADHGAPDIRFVQEDGIFKSEKERYGFGRSEAAHWFTRDTATAKTYADPRRAFDYQNVEPGVVSAYVRLDNPFVVNAAGQNWRDAQKRGKTSDVIAEARANGHDGVIIYNVKDDYNNDKKTRPTTTLTVFSSTQIKSVNNRGTFDPADARIQYQSLSPEAQAMADRIAQALNQPVGPEPDAEVAVSPTLYQVQNLPEWKVKTRAWMEKNGYTAKEIEKHLGAIEGQMRIFGALGPVQLEMLPQGAGLAPAKGKISGPIRSNADAIYKITFDASAMCVKRLEAAATAAEVERRLGRPLAASERMALVALFKSAGKQAPCLYCYVEAPRSKRSSLMQQAQDVIQGNTKPKSSWSAKTKRVLAAAQEEYNELGLTEIDPRVVTDPEFAETPEGKALRKRMPKIFAAMELVGAGATANLPKLYEEYNGQILALPQKLLDELNNYAGLRFFSSSDFQAEHVADLMQAFFDMEIRRAKSHAYTKVPDYVRIFGPTGQKIQTSIFAKEENGEIVMDDWQGMDWETAKAFREQYPNVGTVLVAGSDAIVAWGLEQDWVDYIIPFHYSGLEKKFYETLGWQDFTATQNEKSIVKGKAKKIRMHETGAVPGISTEQGTRNYLALAMERKLVPVFPAFLFKDGLEPVLNKKGKLVKNQRLAQTKRAVERWKAMVEAGEIDWSVINPNYYKVKKDYARTDTPFDPVKAEFNLDHADTVLQAFLRGEAPSAKVDAEIADKLQSMIGAAPAGFDIGVDALKKVNEGQTLFQRVMPVDNTASDGILKEKEVVYEKADRGEDSVSARGGEGVYSEERGMRPLPGARLVELRSTEKRSVPATVVSPRHAAAAMSFLSDAPQEQLSALVLDKNGKPLAILSHSLGNIDSTQVDNRALLGAIQDVAGAKSFYLVHNHPAETAVLSSADRGLSENIRIINEGSGLSYGGIIAVTPSGYGDEFGDNQSYPPPGKQKKVPVVQRMFVKADRVQGLGPVRSPEDIKSNISTITGGAESGIILLSNNNVPIGFLPLDPAEMSRLRGDRLGEVLKSFHRTNATGIVGILPNEASLSAWRNVAAMANAINARPLDALFQNGAGSLDSARMQGKDVSSGGNKVFYQFAGQRAETADKFLLETAQSRVAAGEDQEAVRKETGWFRGLDGKWRFEINDSDAVLTRKKDGSTIVAFFFPGNPGGTKLFYLLEHPALFAAYPWVEDIKVTSSPLLTERGKMAAFDPYKNEIFVSDKLDFSEEKFLPLLLHEIQHAIQKKEDFAAGGDAVDPNYRRISGEIEARNVEARRKMTADERRNTPPSSTQDILDSDALVVFNGGKSFSAPEALMRQQRGEPQAAFTFKTKSGKPLIELFQTANQSSFLHETGHLYLEMIRDLAIKADAPQAMQDLWLQAKTALKIDDGPISREAHEEWARNLEAYFLEGAAPSLGLRKIFAQYAQWLRSLYKQVEQIFLQSGTQFNEDLKPVFDRIFASEKDIEEARSFYSSQKPFFAAVDPKVMAKEREKYEERRLRARESMEDKRLRQLTEAWVKVSGGKGKIRAEVAEEVKARPVVAVVKGAAGGMNMAALDASVGEDLRKQLKAIGRYSSLVKKEGTVDPDILAAENGYDSAVAMVEDLISFPGEKAAITAGVEARMEAERQRIARGLAETDLAADEAYHNDDQLAVLVAEFEILSQQAAQKTKRLEASMVRDVAKQLLASEKVNFATQSSRFARLERRAAKLARAAYERGDAKKAANYKRQEVLNHAMFIESVKLKEGIKKTAARIKRGIKKTKGISPEVKTLLQGLGIQYGILPYKKERDPVRAFEMWNQDLVAKGGKIPTIEGWVEEMRKLGISAPLDPFLNNAAAVPYQQITVGQFRALEEGVRILRRVDRGLHTVTWIDGSTITMEDAIERLQAHVAGRGGKAPDPLTYDPNAVTLAARNFFAEHTKTSTIIQALDNWEAGGLFYQLIYRPVMDADSDLSARWATEAPKIKALFEPIRRQLRKKVVVLGKARPRAQLVAAALNVGNQGNRERLIAGLGINETQLDQLLAPLTTEEMDFVQAVWDYIATFKDEAFAVERRLTGREPAAVDPVPFVFRGKTYAGGYYPVSYDKNLRDQKGEARDAKEALDELFGGTPAGTAMTAHGHLEARASAGTGERLSQELSVISDHVAQVLRDITHREAVVNVAKLLKNKQIMAMITDVVGREKAKQLWPWLVSVSKEGREQIQLTAVEKMLLHFRPAMTFYTQAYKVGTALMQAAGFLQVFEFVQAKHVGQAVWQLYGKGLLSLNMFSDGEIISHPLIKEIREKSPQMNERLLNADRDIRDATKEFSTSESALVAYKKAGFKATVAMQFYVADVVAWQGAYLQALTDGMAEKDAINRADFVVEQAMGAGYTRALSKIQRGGSIQRFLTMFYTFGSVLYNLAARRAGITKKQLASGQYGAAALGASSFLVLQWVMPVLFETLVRGDMVDDDDDETLAEKLLANLLTYPAQSMLIVRELSGLAKGFTYRFSPATRPFESVGPWFNAVSKAIEQEDASIAAKPTAQLIGTATGLIPAQFINSGDVLTDYLTGEDQELSVKELLYGKGGRK